MGSPSRTFIVAEIQRCAADNNGKPLGRRRFQAATGIREADWLGIYWARWGDALREAGYRPNEMQSEVTTEDGLLMALASLTRSLGRFPTNPELKLERLRDPSFPSHNTFSNRLGNRSSQLRRLADFAEQRDELSDIAEYIRALSGDQLSEQADVSETSVDATEFGHVYLLRVGKYYKIGRSNAFGRRERELAIQMPERAITVHVIVTDDPVGIERYWHLRFAERRVRRDAEWFVLDRNDVAAFKRRKFQ